MWLSNLMLGQTRGFMRTRAMRETNMQYRNWSTASNAATHLLAVSSWRIFYSYECDFAHEEYYCEGDLNSSAERGYIWYFYS